MAKLSLKADPTFTKKVTIQRAGKTSVDVEFTFRHKTRPEFAEWLKTLEGKDKIVSVMECASGWELEDPFNEASVTELNDNYMGSARAIVDTYLAELSGERLGN